jgi:predicted ester cyclase
MPTNAEILGVLAEAFNARDWDGARELLSDGIRFVDVASGVTTDGPDGFIEYARGWAGAFSNMKIETLALVADESHAAGEFLGRGIHDGPLPTPTGAIPATGRDFEERFTFFADVAGGKITGVRDYYNAMSLMVQLGLMPEPAGTTS